MSRNDGIRFEIFLEHVISRNRPSIFVRNLNFHKSPKEYRQVDIYYEFISEGMLKRNIVEAKYCGDDKIQNLLQSSKNKRDQQIESIEHITDEVMERKYFIEKHFFLIDNVILATNKYFSKEVHDNKGAITIVEMHQLERFKGVHATLEDAISSIDLQSYNLTPSRLYTTR